MAIQLHYERAQHEMASHGVAYEAQHEMASRHMATVALPTAVVLVIDREYGTLGHIDGCEHSCFELAVDLPLLDAACRVCVILNVKCECACLKDA
jgi:hypothetical protein